MSRLTRASLAIGLLGLGGCDNNRATSPSEPPPAAAAPAPAVPKIHPVSLDAAQIGSPQASMVAGEGTSRVLTTDPANGSYSAYYYLPQIDAPSTVRVRLEVKSGGIGIVVTDAADSNKWTSEEQYAAVGPEAVIEIKTKSLGTPQSLLFRNHNAASSASTAVVKSIEVESAS